MRLTTFSGFVGFVRQSVSFQTRRWPTVAALLLCGIVVILAGCGNSAAQQTPTPVPTVAATATPSGPPRVLFRADWSHGAGAWKLPPHWTIQNGTLVADGHTTDHLPVPYTVTVPRYRVIYTMRVLDVTYKVISCNNYFGIGSLDDSGAMQFQAQSECFGPAPYHGDSALLGANGSGAVVELTYGRNDRTARVDVNGKIVAYFPANTGSVGTVQNDKPNTPAHLYLVSSQVKLAISSFVIMTN